MQIPFVADQDIKKRTPKPMQKDKNEAWFQPGSPPRNAKRQNRVQQIEAEYPEKTVAGNIESCSPDGFHLKSISPP